ncbi:hypothetical protein N431DRAFT_418724 [Stipitochalara longipes BDJ]|nr:hypothetical protein N431DRAFT_418724 [Stipitochalara longipes BDJ]
MYQLEAPSLAVSTRQGIINEFWGDNIPSVPKSIQDDCYFEYLENQCRLARQNDHANQICTLRNICDIVSYCKEGKTREAIKADLSLKFGDSGKELKPHMDAVIDLAVRLWLMVHVGKLPRGVTGQSTLVWREGSLRAVINEQFQHQLILTDSVKFEKVFNLRNVERIADVKIQWTPNLIDHLKFNEDGKKPVLNVFHHATFLRYHEKSTIFPPGLVSETLRTLALLLPSHDKATRKWFAPYLTKLRIDPSALTCGQLKLEDRQIDHFKFWHDKLVVLKQYFDDSQPRTIKQWWFDDRKRVQWFWVAIVLVVCTVLFGIIQCLEGGWQIYKAYYPSA